MNKKTFLLLSLAGVCIATSYSAPAQGADVINQRKASFIADDAHAKQVCPGVCTPHGEIWRGGWKGYGATAGFNNSIFHCFCVVPEKLPVLKSNIKRVGPQVQPK